MRHLWPSLDKLLFREQLNAYLDEQRALREAVEAIERERVEAIDRVARGKKEFLERIADGIFLMQLPIPSQAWSSWIVDEGSQGVPVRFTENADEGYTVRVCDRQGVEVGLYEASTLRLDHFVSVEEFCASYARWCAKGLDEGMVLATSEVSATGVVPTQPLDGAPREEEAKPEEPKLTAQAALVSMHANGPVSGPAVASCVPTPPAGQPRDVLAIQVLLAAKATTGSPMMLSSGVMPVVMAPTITPPFAPTLNDVIAKAGHEALQWCHTQRVCVLCAFADHDGNGNNRHEDACPLRPLDLGPDLKTLDAALTSAGQSIIKTFYKDGRSECVFCEYGTRLRHAHEAACPLRPLDLDPALDDEAYEFSQ